MVIVPSISAHQLVNIGGDKDHFEEAFAIAAEEISIPDDESDGDDSSYDACDELFKQGEYLRMLRQLEREDEAQREKEPQQQGQQDDDDNNSNNALQYKNYLQNKEQLYDDYKHVNYQYIDFGVLDGDSESDTDSSSTLSVKAGPLIIEQDRTVGKGGFVWDAGFILAESVLRMEQNETRWLSNGSSSSQNTKIIELGAGTGITSLMIARARPQTTVHLTDLPILQPLLTKNCQTCPGRATCGVVEWGKPLGDNDSEAYDIVLGADVVAGIYDASGLAKTIYDLSHSKTVVYLACRERLAGVIDRFESCLHQLFTTIERKEADSSNKSPNVFILRVTGKKIISDRDDKITVIS